jgi:hypothetical protein
MIVAARQVDGVCRLTRLPLTRGPEEGCELLKLSILHDNLPPSRREHLETHRVRVWPGKVDPDLGWTTILVTFLGILGDSVAESAPFE